MTLHTQTTHMHTYTVLAAEVINVWIVFAHVYFGSLYGIENTHTYANTQSMHNTTYSRTHITG